jgi:polyphosphate glucokinase
VAIGIDIGGTGIKGAPVDLRTGRLVGARHLVPTPQPATPLAVAAAVRELRWQYADLPDDTPVGVTIPAVVRRGVTRTAANIDPAWIGTHAVELFTVALGTPVVLLNDADAAGLAEIRLGAGRGEAGVVLVITLGTGIGSAVFADGHLVPNTEFGHLTIDGVDCCPWASAAARVRENLSWAQWAARLQEFLAYAESLMWPDLIIIGGAISHDADEFLPQLRLEAPVVRAELAGDAGIIGAAYEAGESFRT